MVFCLIAYVHEDASEFNWQAAHKEDAVHKRTHKENAKGDTTSEDAY